MIPFAAPPPPAAPRFGTPQVIERRLTKVSIKVLLDPNGAVTTGYLKFGPTKALGGRSSLLHARAGQDPVPAVIDIDGLKPHTRYWFRFVARNSAGVSRTPLRRFSTR